MPSLRESTVITVFFTYCCNKGNTFSAQLQRKDDPHTLSTCDKQCSECIGGGSVNEWGTGTKQSKNMTLEV
jgi:hypothetical protein